MGKLTINGKDLTELNISGKKVSKITIGSNELTFSSPPKEFEDHTYYIDVNTGEEKNVDGKAPEGTKEITHIGCSTSRFSYKAPKTLTTFKGTMSKNIKTLDKMFDGCSALTLVNLSKLDTSNVSNMEFMFRDCKSLTTINVKYLKLTSITYIYSMFSGCSALVQISGLANWDVSKVGNFAGMFSDCLKLSDVGDLSKWDTSQVVNMRAMFKECRVLKTAGAIDKWNVSRVKSDLTRDFNTNSPISPIPNFN